MPALTTITSRRSLSTRCIHKYWSSLRGTTLNSHNALWTWWLEHWKPWKRRIVSSASHKFVHKELTGWWVLITLKKLYKTDFKKIFKPLKSNFRQRVSVPCTKMSKLNSVINKTSQTQQCSLGRTVIYTNDVDISKTSFWRFEFAEFYIKFFTIVVSTTLCVSRTWLLTGSTLLTKSGWKWTF